MRREVLGFRIPNGISHAKSEVGVLQKKWAQRGDLPLTEVSTAVTVAISCIKQIN